MIDLLSTDWLCVTCVSNFERRTSSPQRSVEQPVGCRPGQERGRKAFERTCTGGMLLVHMAL